MGAIMNHPADALGMLFNVLIILAIGGLWLLWLRNMKRQKEVETLLVATSAQLEEATRHLESALTEINRLQQRPGSKASTDTPSSAATAGPVHMSAYRQAQATHPDSEPRTAKPAAQPESGAKQATQDEPVAADLPDDLQQIIRLHRLGMDAEKIAAQLKLPQARVNLLLRLHQNRPTGQNG